MGGRAVDGREPGRQRVHHQPGGVHRHARDVQPGVAQRGDRPLVSRLLDGHPGARGRVCGPARRSRTCCRRWRARRPGSAGRPRWRSRCSTTAAAERRQPDRVRREVGPAVGGGPPGTPPRGPVERGDAGCSGGQVDRCCARTAPVGAAGNRTRVGGPAGGTAPRTCPTRAARPPSPRRAAGRTRRPSPSGSRPSVAASARVDGQPVARAAGRRRWWPPAVRRPAGRRAGARRRGPAAAAAGPRVAFRS